MARSVDPPCRHSVTWSASQRRAGVPQPQAQQRSRTAMASRWAGENRRRRRPSTVRRGGGTGRRGTPSRTRRAGARTRRIGPRSGSAGNRRGPGGDLAVLQCHGGVRHTSHVLGVAHPPVGLAAVAVRVAAAEHRRAVCVIALAPRIGTVRRGDDPGVEGVQPGPQLGQQDGVSSERRGSLRRVVDADGPADGRRELGDFRGDLARWSRPLVGPFAVQESLDRHDGSMTARWDTETGWKGVKALPAEARELPPLPVRRFPRVGSSPCGRPGSPRTPGSAPPGCS